MLTNLVLRRPFVVIDLETTGTDAQTARIVEVAALKLHPCGRREPRTRRVNPGVPIPQAASAVHGITDADVAGEPTFAELADGLLAFLDGCDLAGFNLKNFDLRILRAEFKRCGLTFPLDGRAVVDAMQIYHAFERRDLTAAVRFYCGRDHAGAHGAAADALATAEVLDAMLRRYAELPRDAAGLSGHFRAPNAVDAEGKFVMVDGRVTIAFGKCRGEPLAAVAEAEPGYLEWMLRQDFAEDAKAVIREALGAGQGR